MCDVLRCDRSVSGNALEARIPYLDKRYLNFMLNLNPKLKDPKFNNNIEKYILRKLLIKKKILICQKTVCKEQKKLLVMESDTVGKV